MTDGCAVPSLRFNLPGDANRLRILRALHEDVGRIILGALSQCTGLAMANVSRHLARLIAAGMVARRRDGAHAFYNSSDPTLADICDLVCGSLRKRAATIAGS